VSVNGVVVKTLGTKVSKSDEIAVDGNAIRKAEVFIFLLNKPTGYVSSTTKMKKKKTVIDLLASEHQNTRLYPVGRLDYDTAGFLLTNDGNLTQLLTHPSHEVEKEYIVRVQGIVIKEKIRVLRKGVIIDEDYQAIPKEVSG
jgi:23S rRNA pseudouridine2605 synthase